MNLNKILKHIESADQETFDKKEDRRQLLKSLGAKLAVAAVPFVAATFSSKKAGAQSKESIINSLNYLLKAEYVALEFYKKTDSSLISSQPADVVNAFSRIKDNKIAHIDVLKGIINDLGGTPMTIASADIDLSGAYGAGTGPYANSFDTLDGILVQAQMFADGTARMYKGQITEVISDNITTRALLNIHSVEVRQAAYIRNLRRRLIGLPVNPWITGTNSDTSNTAAQRSYDGEAIVTQLGVALEGINGYEINTDMATEAFDEPLDTIGGNNVIDRFIKP